MDVKLSKQSHEFLTWLVATHIKAMEQGGFYAKDDMNQAMQAQKELHPTSIPQ